MAAERGRVVAPESLPFESDTRVAHPKVKVENRDPREDASATSQAWASLGEPFDWSVPKWVKQEKALELPHHSEGRGREYLETVESCASGWRPSCLPQAPEGDVKGQHLPHVEEVGSSSRCPQSREAAQHTSRDASTPCEMEEEPLIEATDSLEMQRQHFRRFCYREAEGPHGNCTQLWELCHQWLQPEKHTKAQILELVILEQFLAVLPSEMQHWVRGFGPGTCSQAVALAEHFFLQQVPPPFVETDRNVSRAVQTLCGAGQLCREVKQEECEDEANLPGGQRSASENWGESPKMLHGGKTGRDELMENVESLKKKKETQVGCLRNPFSGSQREGFEEIMIHEQTCSEKKKNCYYPTPADTFGFPDRGESFHYEESKQIAHPKIHTEKPCYCLLCGESFSQSSHLASHQHCLAQEKPYWVRDTGQSFGLLAHQQFRAGEPVCKNTSSQENLRPKRTRFRKQCATENLHHCAECGKSFLYRSHLIRHQRVHTGEKPYQCSECGKSFSQHQHFVDHWKGHAGENPYQCLACGKSFSYMSQFVIHQRSHTGEKPYRCPVCARGFCQRSHLARHQKKIHAAGESIHAENRGQECPSST